MKMTVSDLSGVAGSGASTVNTANNQSPPLQDEQDSALDIAFELDEAAPPETPAQVEQVEQAEPAMYGIEPGSDESEENKVIYPADLDGILGVDGSRRKVSIPTLAERKQEAHKVRAHENLEVMAEIVLGSLASPAQLETYKKAIRDLNGIDGDVSKGQMLKMPGVSRTGDFTYVGNGLNKTWFPYDGSVQTDTRDGTRTINYR